MVGVVTPLKEIVTPGVVGRSSTNTEIILVEVLVQLRLLLSV